MHAKSQRGHKSPTFQIGTTGRLCKGSKQAESLVRVSVEVRCRDQSSVRENISSISGGEEDLQIFPRSVKNGHHFDHMAGKHSHYVVTTAGRSLLGLLLKTLEAAARTAHSSPSVLRCVSIQRQAGLRVSGMFLFMSCRSIEGWKATEQ